MGRRRCWSGRAMFWRRFRAEWAWRWRWWRAATRSSIERVRAGIGRLGERERREYQRLLSSVEQLWAAAVPEGAADVQTVYVEGVANLLGGRGAGTAEEMTRLRDML